MSVNRRRRRFRFSVVGAVRSAMQKTATQVREFGLEVRRVGAFRRPRLVLAFQEFDPAGRVYRNKFTQ